MTMALRKSKPGYSVFCDEVGGVYSPIPDKYLQKKSADFSLNLRPRIPFKNLNIVRNLAKAYAPLKTCQDNLKRSSCRAGLGETSLKQKVQRTLENVAKKISGKKQRRLQYSTVLRTPAGQSFAGYRERLCQSPSTPNNPFSISTPNLRRSKRLSNLGEYKPDAFTSHLELIQSGIKKLNANGVELNKAIGHGKVDHKIQSKRAKVDTQSRERNGPLTRRKSQSSYKPMIISSTPKAEERKFRRSKSGIDAPGRRLGSKFSKSASVIDARMRGRKYHEIVSENGQKTLRGKYNQALYYDG